MSRTAFLHRITIYPVKSLDGITVESAVVSKNGCLIHDREYAIFDRNGKYVNGKSNERIYALRASFDLSNELMVLSDSAGKKKDTFHLKKDLGKLNSWLSDFFQEDVFFRQNGEGRFMDDPDLGHITLAGTNSYQTIGGWFGITANEEIRRRFRVTLEMEGFQSFEEDVLFSIPGKAVEFAIGEVRMLGVRPRERCIVPTRHPETGEVLHAFPKLFATKRKETLPQSSLLVNYGHYYYFSVDVVVPSSEAGKVLRTGDVLEMKGVCDFISGRGV